MVIFNQPDTITTILLSMVVLAYFIYAFYYFNIVKSEVQLTSKGIAISTMYKPKKYNYSDMEMFFEERSSGLLIRDVCVLYIKGRKKPLVLSVGRYPKIIKEIEKLVEIENK